MKIYSLFPDTLHSRLAPLRNFIDEIEEENITELDEERAEELQCVIDHAWPGKVALESPTISKLVFAFAGFAIGFGLLPY